MEDIINEIARAHEEVMSQLPIPSWDNISDAWAQPGVLDGVRRFIAAIDWNEPFFMYLGGFHLLFLLFSLYMIFGYKGGVGKNPMGALILIIVSAGLVLLASPLNNLGREYHETLFPVPVTIDEKTGAMTVGAVPGNYFDEDGLFISGVYSAPLMLIAFCAQIRLLIAVSSMMISVKKRQLIADHKKKMAGEEKKKQ